MCLTFLLALGSDGGVCFLHRHKVKFPYPLLFPLKVLCVLSYDKLK